MPGRSTSRGTTRIVTSYYCTSPDPPAAPAALAFEHLSKRYGSRSVLADVTLDIEPGEYFGLVGVNGAGKTTCMKALLDFCDVDGGSVSIFGSPHRSTAARARLAYLPEQFLPPYYFSGRGFLEYSARLYGRAVSPSALREMLRLLDLSEAVLEQPVRELSKGMAQKLGLAGCFLSARDLLVLDEPMSGLDPKSRILVKRYLRSLDGGSRTIFFSTHLLFDVQDLCHRMGILHAGELRFVGTPRECCERFGARSLEQAYLACISSLEASLG